MDDHDAMVNSLVPAIAVQAVPPFPVKPGNQKPAWHGPGRGTPTGIQHEADSTKHFRYCEECNTVWEQAHDKVKVNYLPDWFPNKRFFTWQTCPRCNAKEKEDEQRTTFNNGRDVGGDS